MPGGLERNFESWLQRKVEVLKAEGILRSKLLNLGRSFSVVSGSDEEVSQPATQHSATADARNTDPPGHEMKTTHQSEWSSFVGSEPHPRKADSIHGTVPATSSDSSSGTWSFNSTVSDHGRFTKRSTNPLVMAQQQRPDVRNPQPPDGTSAESWDQAPSPSSPTLQSDYYKFVWQV